MRMQELGMTHIHVRTQGKNIIVFSIERNSPAKRAIFTCMPDNDYTLCLSDPRGKWQLIPVVGELPDMLDLLTGKLVFALARWPDIPYKGSQLHD